MSLAHRLMYVIKTLNDYIYEKNLVFHKSHSGRGDSDLSVASALELSIFTSSLGIDGVFSEELDFGNLPPSRQRRESSDPRALHVFLLDNSKPRV